eukprot:TRINITY_DN303_c0_g1_i3.p1 TRINITY_DN303_c0_g1~~TRINITY_DN303_c0_g1_i3.p1  ORF type:complete len:277 (+),score=53.49 TRINITY_DN303_c0_g1_i3:47-832(+)
MASAIMATIINAPNAALTKAPRGNEGVDSSLIASASRKSELFYGQCLPALAHTTRRSSRTIRLLVSARSTAGAVKEFEAEIEKPLGLNLGSKPGGGVVVTGVVPGGNAAKAGLKVGDQVLYTSSFFGDELWPSEDVGFTQTAIRARGDSVYFVLARGASVDVKTLKKRAMPSRFGRKLTDAQKARATHVCLDCGFIYTLPKPFDEQPDSYECPQCSAPKKRFAPYDAETGRAIGGGTPISVLLSLFVGTAAIGAFLFYGLQ